jgi:hypothetical protein
MITKFDKYISEQSELCNEGVRDMMTPISDEKIKELRSKGKFAGEITVDGYTEKQAKSIIKSYSRKLNNVFKDDTENRVVDWVYIWQIPDLQAGDGFSEIHLTLSCNNGKYTIDFVDGRTQSWRNIKNTFSGRVSGRDFQFTKVFYLLEDALGWLESCNIDTSKITRT